MNSFEIGNQLVELCKQGKTTEAINQLYSRDIVSIEAEASPEMPAIAKGIEAIRGKNKWFDDHYSINKVEALGPFPNGDQFTVYFKFNTTDKKSAEKMDMEEIALYTTKNGKIVKEEFFSRPMM